MRITIVLGAFFPVPPVMGGGVEKAWFGLAPEFARRGHEVVIVSRKMPNLPREETIDGVKHVRVDGFNTPPSLIWLKFLDLIYSIRTMSILPPADIIVTNTFWLPILLRDSTRGKVYVHVGRYPKGQMRFYSRAARLQAPSLAIADKIAKQVPALANKATAIPYPVTTPAIASAPSTLLEREKIILYVGRVHPEKGVHLLVEAFAQGTRAAHNDWKLMIVGPTETHLGGGGKDYLSSLQRLARGAKIQFDPAIFDPIALARRFQSARLFVYPSLAERGESFGLAPLEAMAHGCAVLVSNLGCFQDFIRDGETGFIFDHRTTDPAGTLRAKIDNLIADEALLEQVAARGQQKSVEYSVERVADQFLKDFESLNRD
jgi:glycosyltransferase involved in cell wall biosynthesis